MKYNKLFRDVPKTCTQIAKLVDPDQSFGPAHTVNSLIWVHTVCPSLPVPIPRVFMAFLQKTWSVAVAVACRRMIYEMSQLMRLWYLSHRRPGKAQASLCTRTVSPEPSLFAHMKYWSRRRVLPKIMTSSPSGWLRMRVWRISLWKVP